MKPDHDLLLHCPTPPEGEPSEWELPPQWGTLTFQTLRRNLRRHRIPFTPDSCTQLGLLRPQSGDCTPLGRLLSDQNPQVTCVTFPAPGGTEELTRTLTGSLFSQWENCVELLKQHNKTLATFQGGRRVEKPNYPPQLLEQALLQAVLHRDYDHPAPLTIRYTSAQVTFTCPGGPARPADQALAGLLTRLCQAPREDPACFTSRQLRWEDQEDLFCLQLRGRNAALRSRRRVPATLTPPMLRVLDYLTVNGQITEPQVAQLLHLTPARVTSLLTQMRQLHLLVMEGRGRGKCYLLPKKVEAGATVPEPIGIG